MTAITRRNALLGASAAVAVAGVPVAVQASDAILLARIGRFHDLYNEWCCTHEKQAAHRAEIEARPDCPPCDPATGSRANSAFLEANDAFRYWDQAQILGKQTGALVNAIFETPAQTATGALEKLKIAYTAVGDGGGTYTGDIDLEAWQDLEAPWMEAVIADFERLIGGMRL